MTPPQGMVLVPAVAQQRSLEPDRGLRPPWRVTIALALMTMGLVGLAAQAAYFVAASQPEVFAARSQIEYRGESWVETAAVTINSRSLTGPLAEGEGIEIDEFEKQLGAGQLAGTQILSVEFRSEDADQALRVTDELTNAYLSSFQQPVSSRPREYLNEQLEATEAELVVATEVLLATEAETPAAIVAARHVQNLQDRIAAINGQVTDSALIDIEAQEDRPTLVTAPYVLDEPVEPAPLKRAVFGVLAGLLVSAIIAFFVIRRTAT